MTIEELLAAKAKVEKALLRGEAAIEFENRRTEFRSYQDMLDQLAWIDGQIAAVTDPGSSTGAFRRVRVVSSDKDLG